MKRREFLAGVNAGLAFASWAEAIGKTKKGVAAPNKRQRIAVSSYSLRQYVTTIKSRPRPRARSSQSWCAR
jgi:hypothetical protein